MRRETTLIYDVDTQRDFMEPGGALFVPAAPAIVPNLAALIACARARHPEVRVAGSVDRHFPDDPELARNGGAYPDHCMDGSPGQEKIDATRPRSPCWVGSHELPPGELAALLKRGGEVYLEKQRFDVFAGNRNADRVFDYLLTGIEDVIVCGVVTEVCVDQAIAGLHLRPVQLHVPADAIAALDETRAREVLARWRDWGIHLTSTREVLDALA